MGDIVMGLFAKDTGNEMDFYLVPEGMYHAVTYRIYDLGNQYSQRFDNHSRKVMIMWEIQSERIKYEKNGEQIDLPASVSKEYTLSLNKKSNLRKDLESWRNRRFTEKELEGFNLEKLMGINCTVQIIHNDAKTWANVQTVLPPIDKTKVLVPENPQEFFSFDEPGTNIPLHTPDWILTKIKQSPEWQNQKEPTIIEEPPPFEDDMPF